ncbi:MAG: response regulator [Planctomycetota bacterium]|nr:response regulator [Planctomycetota bacterium]MDI6788413.1 response regulator [Planctomycetota bacterium]
MGNFNQVKFRDEKADNNKRVGMQNILIVDHLQETGVLIKSILSSYYGTSLSEDFSDAVKKIETGLFDLVIMEVERLNSDTGKFVERVRNLIPQFPIIVISGKAEDLHSLNNVEFLTRPFRCVNLMESIYKAISSLHTQSGETNTCHYSITYSVEISMAEQKSSSVLKCSLVDLSLKGFLAEPLLPLPCRSAGNNRVEFQDFFKTLCPESRLPSKPLYTHILLKEQEPLTLSSHLAFIERRADDTAKKAGFSFTDPDEIKNKLLELLGTS